MAEKIDSPLAEKLIRRAIGNHPSIRDAREAGENIIRIRDEIVVICMPYGTRLARQLIKLPGMSRCEFDDIEAAAFWGVVEGVDSFMPSKGVHIQTHLWNRIRKRMNEERCLGHWVIAKPPRELYQAYLTGRMTQVQVEAYLDTFLRPYPVPGEDGQPDYGSSERFGEQKETGGRQ